MKIGAYVAFALALGGCVDTAQTQARAEAHAQATAACRQLAKAV
jgi:hypothetical protein